MGRGAHHRRIDINAAAGGELVLLSTLAPAAIGGNGSNLVTAGLCQQGVKVEDIFQFIDQCQSVPVPILGCRQQVPIELLLDLLDPLPVALLQRLLQLCF